MIVSTPLAIVFLLAAIFSVVEFVRSRRAAEIESYIADREAQATHVLMNGGMAAMFAPTFSAAIERGIVITYGIAIAALAVRLALLVAQRKPAITTRVAGTVYHALGLTAMIYAIRLMPADMRGMMMASTWPALVLGVIFALDGVATALLIGLFPKVMMRMERAIDGSASVLNPRDARTLRAIRVAAIPHCIMDAGMVLMLLT